MYFTTLGCSKIFEKIIEQLKGYNLKSRYELLYQ
jgi:hypothetical protein